MSQFFGKEQQVVFVDLSLNPDRIQVRDIEQRHPFLDVLALADVFPNDVTADWRTNLQVRVTDAARQDFINLVVTDAE